MKVETEIPVSRFGKLRPGDCFQYAGGHYMKTNNPMLPAVDLQKGCLVEAKDCPDDLGITVVMKVTLTQ